MVYRNYRGKKIPVKKGGVNIQLCAQERALLKSIVFEWLLKNEKLSKNNKVIKRDYCYFRKIYGKLSKKKVCPNCGKWI